MRLCFGTFATVLNHCFQYKQQAELVSRIVLCIDSQNSSIIENWTDFKEINEEIAIGTIKGKGPLISKILSCKKNFVFSDGTGQIVPPAAIVVERIRTLIAPYIEEYQKPKVILALLDIIQKDNHIKNENFQKYFGICKQQLLFESDFVFCEFIEKILLYITFSNIDNRVGETCVKEITEDYIDNLANLYEYEYHWDSSAQKLTLFFNSFNKALQDYEIDTFINHIDPTNQMNYEWVEKCDSFLEYIIDNIFKKIDAPSIKGFTLLKIQQFAQTLNDYTQYLGFNMRPIAEMLDVFVPIYRGENAPLALEFANNATNYRKQLCSIYQEMQQHMIDLSKSTPISSE